MDRLVRHWIPATITIGVFLLVLLGYAFPGTGLSGILIEWAVIVAAFAFLLGLFNILRVHFRQARRLQQGGIYSLVFLFAALVTSVIMLLELFKLVPSEPPNQPSALIFRHIVSPVGASLAALVVFTLTLAAFRLLRTRRSERAKSILFILVVIVVLLGGILKPLAGARDWLVNVFGMAGMRGLLLGVALGTVITALRVLWPRSES